MDCTVRSRCLARVGVVASLTVLGTVGSVWGQASSARMFWTDDSADRLRTASLSGGSILDLRTGLGDPHGLAINAASDFAYWAEYGGKRIMRGSAVETTVTPTALYSATLDRAVGVTVDLGVNRMFWADRGTPARILRASNSTANGAITTVVSAGLLEPTDCAYLPNATPSTGGYVYWSDAGTDKVQRCSVSSTGTVGIVEDVLTGLNNPSGIAIDITNTMLYVADAGSGQVLRSTVLGVGLIPYMAGLSNPHAVAVEPISGWVYWADASTGGSLKRATLAGASAATLATGLGTIGDLLTLYQGSSSTQNFVYWAEFDAGRIRRSTITGAFSPVQVVPSASPGATVINQPSGLGINSTVNLPYWCEMGGQRIVRSTSTGGSPLILQQSQIDEPRGLALFTDPSNSANSRLIWADDGRTKKIVKANITGLISTILPIVTTGLVQPRDVAYDSVTNLVYWTDIGNDTVKRCDINGAGVTTLMSGLNDPTGIVLELVGRKMYIAERGANQIIQANLDGTGMVVIHSGLSAPLCVGADSGASRLYWHDGAAGGSLYRSNLDGSNPETLVTGTGEIPDMVITPAELVPTGRMYWTGTPFNRISLASLTGANLQQIAFGAITGLYGLAADATNDRFYWTDFVSKKIQRAGVSADRTSITITDLVTTSVDDPRGLAIDLIGNRMFWADRGATKKIVRATTAGTNVTNIVTTGLSDPRDVAYDPVNNLIYWTDVGTDKVQRSDVDGLGILDVMTGLSDPTGVAMELATKRIYVSDSGNNRIVRSNLDGTGFQVVVTGLTSPQSVAVDSGAGKVYWADNATGGRIQRSNLDGSSIETLVTGQTAISKLVVAPVPTVRLEFRPETGSSDYCIGDTIEVGLYAVSNLTENVAFIAANVGFSWNQTASWAWPTAPTSPTAMQFQNIDNTGSAGDSSGSPPTGGAQRSEILCPDSACRANEQCPSMPVDGDGFYLLLGPSSGSLNASPAGLRLTKFFFGATGSTASGRIAVNRLTGLAPSACQTFVYDAFIPNYNILSQVNGFGSATVTINVPFFTFTPSDLTIPCDGSGDPSVLTNWLASPTAVGTCGETVASITNNYAGAPGDCSQSRSVVVTWTDTDTEGNTNTTTAILTLGPDNTPPVLTVPSDASAVADEPGGAHTFPSLPSATATDACSAATITFTRSDGMPNLLDPYRAADSPVTITWRATDACGNTSTGTNSVTITQVGDHTLNVSVELSPTMDDLSPGTGDVVTRCITFEFWACPGDTSPSEVIQRNVPFPVDAGLPHRVDNLVVPVSGAGHTCLTARDRYHTLRSTAPDFTDNGSYYSATFVGNRSIGGHWLLQGNLNDDRYIDVLDFGVYVNRFQVVYASGDSPCGTPFFHADFTGDGRVFTEDFTFIAINILRVSEPNCCGSPGLDEGPGPVTEISVAELWRRGLGELAVADLDGDGTLSLADMDYFAQSTGQSTTPSIPGRTQKQDPAKRSLR